VLYRIVVGFVGLHVLEDVGLLSLGYFLSGHVPAWIFFPVGIGVSTLLFTLFAKRILHIH
jgi:hypothetical protein